MLKLFGKRRAYDVKENNDDTINAEYAFENVVMPSTGTRVSRVIASFFNECSDPILFEEWVNETFTPEEAEYILRFRECGTCETQNDIKRWLATRSK